MAGISTFRSAALGTSREGAEFEARHRIGLSRRLRVGAAKVGPHEHNAVDAAAARREC